MTSSAEEEPTPAEDIETPNATATTSTSESDLTDPDTLVPGQRRCNTGKNPSPTPVGLPELEDGLEDGNTQSQGPPNVLPHTCDTTTTTNELLTELPFPNSGELFDYSGPPDRSTSAINMKPAGSKRVHSTDDEGGSKGIRVAVGFREKGKG